jgi:dihydroneopterin aldolase
VTRDRIELRGLRAVGIHGDLPEEQTRAQPFEIDLELHLDLRAAGQSDDLNDTIDYGALAESVERIVTRERFQLLERLAERIADEVRHDQRVDAVVVTVRKLRPPVAVDLASAAVTITRP